jgi:hypothetical protein
MEKEIKVIYEKFFVELKINPTTGVVFNTNDKLKFATYPFIGKNYSIAKRKILFVGLDIGKDETPDKIQSLDERRDNIACNFGFNPHMAGTYISALYLLKDVNNWNNVWDKVKTYHTAQQATKIQQHTTNNNPLDFVALTNFYKFVDVDKQYRTGDVNRKFIDSEKEVNLFLEEVKLLNPDIILFQGKMPSDRVISEIHQGRTIYLAPHPSNRKPGGRQPENYINSFRKI